MATIKDGISCPLPLQHSAITLAHGGGGKLTRNLIADLFAANFRNELLDPLHDGAVLPATGRRMAFTTDSYVVHPLFFPGGDIGSLAVNGTVNDLAMCGARPLYLSCSVILEEGLPFETLQRVVHSMQAAASHAGVQIVTGDTKVVDRGKGDGIFVNTAGVGILEHDRVIAPSSIRSGDAILLSGDVGRHGVAILAAREELQLESPIESDCASVAGTALALLEEGIEVHCMRDLTRGGLATALAELAESADLHVAIEEDGVAILESVNGICELLGLDPLYLANEGRFVAFVPPEQAGRALQIMKAGPGGALAALIGAVDQGFRGRVTLRSRIGSRRVLDLLTGDQLPRIC